MWCTLRVSYCAIMTSALIRVAYMYKRKEIGGVKLKTIAAYLEAKGDYCWC